MHFADVWTFATSKPPSDVAARVGSVFFNVAQADGHVYTRAVSTSGGSLLWAYDLGEGGFGGNRKPYGPAYGNGRVASMTFNTTSTAAPLQVINAANGSYISTVKYPAQHSDGSVPTFVGDQIFFAAGYYGNSFYLANAATGENLWNFDYSQQYQGNVSQGESVAVDQYYVYYFSASYLIIAKRDGGFARAIANPFFSNTGISYFGEYVGAPMLDGKGHIFVFADNRSAGQSRPIVAFSFFSDKPIWRSGYSYAGHPAVRSDRVYAVRSASTIVDVIDVSNGLLVNSIDVGGAEDLSSNVVVSDSHIFVSSAKTTFAIDTGKTGFPVVWKTSFGGSLAVTPDGFLMISAPIGLHAVKLN